MGEEREVWYRVEVFDRDTPTLTTGEITTRLLMAEHLVAEHTPRGVRLQNGKWCSNTSRKRYAYPTQEQAMESFLARKTRQVAIQTVQLANSQADLRAAQKGDYIPQADFYLKVKNHPQW